MTASGWDNPAVREGMRRMLEHRAELVGRGERMIGWKLAFGAPAWLEKFDIPGPLVGFLPQSRNHPPGAAVPVRGWVLPVAEPEIAMYLSHDVDDPARAEKAVFGLGPAIELADVDSPPDDIGDVLAGNIFHRAVILGEPDPTRGDGDVTGMRARIVKNGSQLVDTDDLESLTGKLVPILRHAAALLDAAGEQLRSGDVVIMGSVVPPIQVRSGEAITFELSPLAPISVTV